jgi:hypothetical protein
VITSRHGKKPGPRARAICRLPGRRSRPCQRCIVKKGAGTAKNHQARIHKHPPRGSDDQPAILISGTSGESLNAPLAASHLLRFATAGRIGARLRARIEGHGDPCRMHGERPAPTQRGGAIRFMSPQSGVRAVDISF